MALSRIARRRIRTTLAAFWLLFYAFMWYSMQASGVDPSMLTSGRSVQVVASEHVIQFRPDADTAAAGLILYPGALVDPHAYAPLARRIAEAGYPVVIIKVPFRMDLFDWQWERVKKRTRAVVLSASSDRKWVVGGHSRGGKMAARLAAEQADFVDGLLLIGTSHPREIDLSRLPLDVVKVYGSRDGLASEEEIESFAHLLPASARFVRIEGGNHRQFGYYGWQLGDREATIDREAQTAATATAALDQLSRISNIF